MTEDALGFNSDEWLTFVQANTVGRKVRKGSKATHLTRVVEYGRTNKQGKVEKKVGIKGFAVFNLDQTEINPDGPQKMKMPEGMIQSMVTTA